MKIITQLLKFGAIISLLLFFLVSILTVSSFQRKPLVLKVQEKYISGDSYRIKGGADIGGTGDMPFSKSFFDKAQIGDTIRYKTAYQVLIRNGQIKYVTIGRGVRYSLPVILSSLFPIIIFFKNRRLLRLRFIYWLIGAIELLNFYIWYTFFFFRH